MVVAVALVGMMLVTVNDMVHGLVAAVRAVGMTRVVVPTVVIVAALRGAVVIAVALVGMVQVTVDEVVRMAIVVHGLVAAVRAVGMTRVVALAAVIVIFHRECLLRFR